MSLTLEQIKPAVMEIVNATPAVDMHTHLFAPHFGPLLLWGIDELLTYHYLVAEVMRIAPIPYKKYWQFSKREMADYSWEHLFLKRSPLSEACRGVLSTLERLGLDPAERNLEKIRKFYREQKIDDYVSKVMEIANIPYMVMTNDPFDSEERPVWDKMGNPDSRFKAALRIDPLLTNWDTASSILRDQGYEVSPSMNDSSLCNIRKFLDKWADAMNPLYMAVSLPPSFSYPDESIRTRIIDTCIIPFAQDRNLPFALMIGVKKLLNPDLRLAGDSVGKSDIECIENLCLKYPNQRFLVTFLSRENQHELCVTARKFNNLLPFGCWWFMNNPSIIDEITRERIELLGMSFVPQHSDARVLDQVIYKWHHSRGIIAGILSDKYADIIQTGWTVSREEIQRDVKELFQDNFERFCA